jgi:hypothetical protein
MQATTDVRTTGRTQESSGMLRRSELANTAAAISKSWTGQGQLAFASLVKDWETRLPTAANRLVYNIFGYKERVSEFFSCSEDMRISVFAALKKAKTESQANGALNTLMSMTGDTIIRRLDDAQHVENGASFPRYTFQAKTDLLATELQLG